MRGASRAGCDASMPSAATRAEEEVRSMDATILNVAIYLTATFAAALVTGVAGFAFELVAAGVWLHILTPLQTATLIIAFGLVVQGISVWKLRHALRWSRLWPFLLGGAFGVPLGGWRFWDGPVLTMSASRSAWHSSSTAPIASF